MPCRIGNGAVLAEEYVEIWHHNRMKGGYSGVGEIQIGNPDFFQKTGVIYQQTLPSAVVQRRIVPAQVQIQVHVERLKPSNQSFVHYETPTVAYFAALETCHMQTKFFANKGISPLASHVFYSAMGRPAACTGWAEKNVTPNDARSLVVGLTFFIAHPVQRFLNLLF